MKKLIFQLAIWIIALPFTSEGQQYKYGKVGTDLLFMTSYAPDSTAEALITFKSGYVKIRYYTTEGSFKQIVTIKKQIKLFTENVKDNVGNIEIIYYHPKNASAKEKVTEFKGTVYNLENGKVKEYSVKGENKFETRVNKNYVKLTVAIPNLTKNSVFEYQYDIESDYFRNLDDWFIQDWYPVVYNEYITSVPVYYTYQTSLTGGIAPVKKEDKRTNESITYRYKKHAIGLQPAISEQGTIDVEYRNMKFVFENIPAFKTEKFCNNPELSRSKISNQLVLISFPDEPIKDMATSYEKINANLMEDNEFGKMFVGRKMDINFVGIDTCTTDLSRARNIYNHFASSYKWNESNSFYAWRDINELSKEGGCVGDINLNYISALNKAGIKSNPVLLSLKGHGLLHPVFPDYSQFNYVIAATQIGDRFLLSDPCGKLPFGILKHECYNGDGWMVTETGGQWQSLTNNVVSKRTLLSETGIADGNITYKTSINETNYFMFGQEQAKDTNKDITKNQKPVWLGDFILDSLVMTELKEEQAKYKLYCRQEVGRDEDIYYINPFPFSLFDTNPFTETERINHVDFPYLQEYKFVSNIKIPGGFTYELPVASNIKMDEDGSLSFKYTPSMTNNVVTVIADFKVKRTNYEPVEYPGIKDFFNRLIEKMQQPVVVKKVP